MTPDTFGKNLIRRAFKPNPPMKLIISDDDNDPDVIWVFQM